MDRKGLDFDRSMGTELFHCLEGELVWSDPGDLPSPRLRSRDLLRRSFLKHQMSTRL